ncbi:MAG: hypothetical protein ACOC97_01745 [Myxococcota bacterium]
MDQAFRRYRARTIGATPPVSTMDNGPLGVPRGVGGSARRGAFAVALCALVMVVSVPVRADEPQPAPEAAGVPVPRPRARPAHMAGEVHLEAVFPVVDASLCPDGAGCVFGAGAGVGGLIEKRWLSGIALGAALDLWFLDGNGVQEVTVVQNLAASLRYHLLPRRMTHPFFGVAIGGVLLGDSFKAATGGATAELVLGAEIEMSEGLALVVATSWRLLVTGPFTTANDGVSRSGTPGIDLGATIRLGLTILE